MFEKILRIVKSPDLLGRIGIISGILIAFRLMAAVPIPGIDSTRLIDLFNSNSILGFLNVFSGGALSSLSIVMLGVGPYITASIVLQLLTMIFPKLKALYYENGSRGRAQLNRITRQLSVPLAALQAYTFLNLLNQQGVFTDFTPLSVITNVIVATAGSLILVWLGDIITEQKLGNGVSLLIFAGIVSAIPETIRNSILTYDAGQLPTYIAYALIAIAVVGGVVLVTQGERKINILYARQIRGMSTGGAISNTSYLPIKVNQAGVIPIIFAVSIILFPQFLSQIIALIYPSVGAILADWSNYLLQNQWVYSIIYFVLVFAFTFFYTSITFEPKEIALNLKRSGGSIPGIRPGEPTEEHLGTISNRVTLFGALFLGLIAIFPNITQAITGATNLSIQGTSLLIVVSVALDSIRQLNSQLALREYEIS
ncbi:MAG: preprotein translocase subunit SecY [Candidatus Harrisonbacteria bacterium]|nr:preprotein translocase subunit SecY [Candidatus Harrisonbacteria bacterium]